MTARAPVCSPSGWNAAGSSGVADGVVTISPAQLGYLLSGIDWRHPQESWRPTSMG
jgi:hypothetical protein